MQAQFLCSSFRRPRVYYGSDYLMVENLKTEGLIESAGRDPFSKAVLYQPTREGLLALLNRETVRADCDSDGQPGPTRLEIEAALAITHIALSCT